MTTTSWAPSSEIDVTSGGLTSIVIYRSYIENTAYSTADGTEHVLMGSTNLIYKNSDSDVVELNITQVNYDKRVYQPGMLTVKMTMTGGLDTTKKTYAEILKKIFLSTECAVDFVTTTDAGDYFVLARYYYVKKLSLANENGTSVVTMTCYSPDYKLTQDKLCRVFNGKKFAKEIFPDVVGAITKNGTAVFNSCTNPQDVTAASYYVSCNDLLYLCYNQGELQSNATFTADENSQSTNNSNSSSGSTPVAELMQPYLVQYNESTYDFLARVANRCGEFMYYEYGVFRLGLPEDTRNSMTTGTAHTTLDPDNTTYPELSLDDDTGLDPQLSFFNYLESGKSIVAEAKKNYVNAENSADEDLYQYQLNQDSDIPSIDPMDDSYILIATMSTFLAGTNVMPAIMKALIGTLGVMLIKMKTTLFGYRKYQFEAYDAIYSSKTNEEKATALTDLYKNLCNAFYQHISDCEKDASSKTVIMDFDNQLPETFLGDSVTNSDGVNDVYIVTAMRGEYSLSGHKHYVEAVPMMTKPSGETIRYYADGAALIIPPYAVEHKLKGIPQEAIVRDTNDPLRMGRVRVTYLWQDAENIEIEEEVYDVTTDTTHSSDGFTPWIRMNTPYAGNVDKHGGILMTPSVGSHVMVGYFNDNMEMPYVQGALYSEKLSAPGFEMERINRYPGSDVYKPTAQVRTIQSESGHSITFIDNPENSFLEDIALPPLQLLKLLGISFSFDQVNGGGMVLSDKSGLYKIAMNADTRDISINSPLGTVNVNAFTGITINAPNGDINLVGKNINIKAGNNLNIEAGTNVARDPNPRNIAQKITSGIVAAAAGMTGLMPLCLVYTSFDSARFVDYTFLRCFWEIIFRPVEGTLSISTTRNIAMSAGKGRAFVPAYSLSDVNDSQARSLATKDTNPMVRAYKVLAQVKQSIDEYYNRKLKLYMEVVTHVDKLYSKLTAEKDTGAAANKYVTALTLLTTANATAIKERLMSNNAPKTKAQIVASFKNDNNYTDPLSSVIITNFHGIYHHYANDLKSEYNAALKAYKAMGAITDNNADLLKLINKRLSYCKNWGVTELQIDSISQTVTCLIGNNANAAMDLTIYNADNSAKSANVKIHTENRNKVTMEVMWKVVKKLDRYLDCNTETNVIANNVLNTDNWKTFVNSIKPRTVNDPHVVQSTLESWIGLSTAVDLALKSTKLDQALKACNWNGCAGPRAWTDVTTGGRIMMSSEAGKTMITNNSGTGFEARANPSVDTVKDFLKSITGMPPELDENQVPIPRDPGIFWNPDSDVVLGDHAVQAQ